MSARSVAAAANAILRKDLLSLLPLAILTASLFAGDVFVTRLDLLPIWGSFRDPVLQLAFAVLVMSVVQLDSPASLVDDWLCRPVPRGALLAAKIALLLLVVYLPRAAAILVCDLSSGRSVAEALQDAVRVQDPFLPLAAPLLLFIALVTRTLVQAFGVLIAIFLAVFVIPTPLVREPGPLEPAIGEALAGVGLGWLAFTPAVVVPVCLLFVAAWLVYWRRRLHAARVLLVVNIAATLLLALLPMRLMPFEAVFAIQSAAAPPSRPADAGSVYLRQPRACLPATLVADLATDPAFSAARKSAQLVAWSADQLEKTQPDDLAFLTSLEPRGLPADWRVKLNYVRADYRPGGGASAYSLRPATYNTDAGGGALLSHSWILPASAARSSAADARLELRYFLTLLEPRDFELAVDGRRRRLPGLGYCSARIEPGGSHIDVDCFTPTAQAAQISAELVRIPASRVYGPLSLAPRWTRALQARHVRLAVATPRLTKHAAVTITAWTVRGYLEKSLISPGVLGGDANSCPLPGSNALTFPQSIWRDAAPHETSSITVADGVQLEVVDFGGTGAPILLLPGLGATAHSFDDFAPRLARHHRVVAMTRRGTGYSSKPDFGYDTATLSGDVLQVMDALALDRVVLAGHSIAGDELTWLGSHHPERFRALVYLDAAYDRSRDTGRSRYRELSQRLPPEPAIPPAALRDPAAMRRLLLERGHVPLPEGELIAFFNFDQPFLAGTPNIAPRIQQAVQAQLESPDYGAIKLPALAIYAIPDPSVLPPWYDRNDARLRATLDELTRLRETQRRADIDAFRRGVAQGRVIELPGASHYVMQSSPTQVLDAIEEFLAEL